MKLHPSIEQLLSEIEAFRGQAGMSVTGFGLAATGDPNFVRDLNEGRIPGLRLIDHVRDFMQSRSKERAA